MSQNQQTPPAQKPQSDDPLASLHRMSTTAGVASQEYVAINQTAIATFLLGLASISVVMANLLLVLPVVAIVCGVIALRQIANSNGTQTGKLLALLGTALAVVMMGSVIVPAVKMYYALNEEEGRIVATADAFGEALVSKDYDRAASMVEPGFFTKKKLTREAFAARWQTLSSNPFFGDLQSVLSNGRVVLEGQTAQGRSAATLLMFRYSKSESPLRRSATLRKDASGQWKIDDLPEVFSTPAAEPGSGAPAAANPR